MGTKAKKLDKKAKKLAPSSETENQLKSKTLKEINALIGTTMYRLDQSKKMAFKVIVLDIIVPPGRCTFNASVAPVDGVGETQVVLDTLYSADVIEDKVHEATVRDQIEDRVREISLGTTADTRRKFKKFVDDEMNDVDIENELDELEEEYDKRPTIDSIRGHDMCQIVRAFLYQKAGLSEADCCEDEDCC